jgi:hypothetical protein
MTKDEKLKKALEALKNIYSDPTIEYTKDYAKQAYILLTAPRMEPVEVKRWEHHDKDENILFVSKTPIYLHSHDKTQGHRVIELTGSYQRPVSEPEVWEGQVVDYSPVGSAVFNVPYSWIGKTVEVRLKEGE